MYRVVIGKQITRIMHHFRNLTTWKKAMELTDITYQYCKGLPKDERYNLIDQINRSSCSVPSNIAEGSGKRSPKQFAEFLSVSISSAYELETQLLICQRRNYGDYSILNAALALTIEIQKMLYALRNKILRQSEDD